MLHICKIISRHAYHPSTLHVRRLARERGPSHSSSQIMGATDRPIAARIVYVHPVPTARIIESMTEIHTAPNEHRIRLFFRKTVRELRKRLES